MSPTPQPRAAVIGLGLIGGSIARDLAALGWDVLGDDRSGATLREACAEGVVRAPVPATGDLAADVVVFALPLTELPVAIEAFASRLGAVPLVMDVGSTKASALAAAERAGLAERFVGAHPMAGDHRSGWSASRRWLFDGRHVYLCATPATSEDALRRANHLWRLLGGRPEPIDAGAHDQLVARTSHLPQLVSKTVGLVLADAGIDRDQLGPGGRDVTRLAASDPDLWTAIALDNRAALLDALTEFRRRLNAMADALKRREAPSLRALFLEARRWSDRAG